MRDHHRRPVSASLRAIYDAGVSAHGKKEPCPYDPPRERGDDLRAHLWRQGFEDQETAQAVADLV